jgi:hypothetical protein
MVAGCKTPIEKAGMPLERFGGDIKNKKKAFHNKRRYTVLFACNQWFHTTGLYSMFEKWLESRKVTLRRGMQKAMFKRWFCCEKGTITWTKQKMSVMT